MNVNQRKTLQEGKTGVFHFDFFNYHCETKTLLSLKCKLRHSDIIYRKKIHTSWYLEAFLALLKIKTARQFCEKSRLQNAHNYKPGKFEGPFTTPYNEYKI